MKLFDVESATRAWNTLSSKYSDRYQKQLSAWSRLSYHMRHSYSPHYDGGLLRVIAFFGESFPDYITQNEVVFQAGPKTVSISSNLNSNQSSERYLLLRMAEYFSEDEHLNHYIKRYTNAYHESSKRVNESTMFDQLHEILETEYMDALRNGDNRSVIKLKALADMMSALSLMVF